MKNSTAAIYLFVQSALTVAWWLLLFAVPRSRALFSAAAHPASALLSFLPADLLCVAVGSLVAGRWLVAGDRRAHAALWFTTGALSYAALYCVGLLMFTGDALLATACMAPASVITLRIALGTTYA